ncbi:hypothetical protein [Microbacterium sp.]|nr:hypothetical protein [Microbacterium sp.]
MSKKGLPYYTIGGTRRLDLNELDAWVTGQ